MNDKHVVVTSGGLDSTTLLAKVRDDHPFDEIVCVSFDYGQRHNKELKYAGYQSSRYGATLKVVDLRVITELIAPSGSSLVSDTDVPDGHYAEESMKATVVPNRNMMMASIAAAHAVAISAKGMYMGVHAGDHFIYPDCRPRFFRALDAAVSLGNAGFGSIPEVGEGVEAPKFIHTPFIRWTKNGIADLAFELDVDIANTWSCYKGGDKQCGKCGTCVERIEAIASTGHADPTQYEDSEYWKTVTK